MATTETPAPRLCRCLCGRDIKPGRYYLPGHDARHVAVLVSYVRAGFYSVERASSELPTPALHNKMVGQLRRLGYTYGPIWNRWFDSTGTVVPQ